MAVVPDTIVYDETMRIDRKHFVDCSPKQSELEHIGGAPALKRTRVPTWVRPEPTLECYLIVHSVAKHLIIEGGNR